MEIIALTVPTYEDFVLHNINKINKDSLILVAQGVFDCIDLNAELAGKTNVIKGLCMLSGDKNATLIVSLKAKLGENTYLSAIVIDKGRLLGICDMTHGLGGDFALGSCLRVFETSIGRFGILIGDDILFFEAARIEALLDAEILLMFGDACDYGIAPRANCELNGRSGILVAPKKLEFFNCKDKKTKDGKVVFEPIIDDKYLKARRKDIYRQLYSVVPY